MIPHQPHNWFIHSDTLSMQMYIFSIITGIILILSSTLHLHYYTLFIYSWFVYCFPRIYLIETCSYMISQLNDTIILYNKQFERNEHFLVNTVNIAKQTHLSSMAILYSLCFDIVASNNDTRHIVWQDWLTVQVTNLTHCLVKKVYTPKSSIFDTDGRWVWSKHKHPYSLAPMDPWKLSLDLMWLSCILPPITSPTFSHHMATMLITLVTFLLFKSVIISLTIRLYIVLHMICYFLLTILSAKYCHM